MRIHRAFTLVEMLVVITIIVVLAGITYPVCTAAVRHARAVACQSNLRQLAMALRMGEQDGRIPREDGAKFVAGLYRNRLLTEPAIFVCPCDATCAGEPRPSLRGAAGDPVPAGACSYAGRRNGVRSKASIAAAQRAGIPESQIAVFADPVWMGPNGPETPHGDRLFIAFLDGHVETRFLDKHFAGGTTLKMGDGAPAPLDGLQTE